MIEYLEKLASSLDKDEHLKKIVRYEVPAEVHFDSKSYPLIVFTLGSKDTKAPTLFVTGGFHGLERIGAQLAWSLLKTTMERLAWDKALCALLENIRLVFFPLVNPVGYFNNSRGNGNSVDLMRNSPIEAAAPTLYLVGGHRISPRLPWYQGTKGTLELENEVVLQVFKKQVEQSICAVGLDFHSGFGMKDRLWFPYSYTPEPFENLAEMHALIDLFEQIHPYHIYQIEPQSKAYLLNGDIWDYLYLGYRHNNESGTFIPLTLEMGSWTWVRKNPLQIFSRHGAFNPTKEHRVKRTYRRHHLLYDFLLKALNSHEAWASLDKKLRPHHEQQGAKRWFD